VVVFTISTIRWPLAGDASLMHYIDFLMEHGRVPYRDIADMNLPGSYLIDYAVMHVLGEGSLAWRLFDLALIVTSSLAMISISRPHGWFPGVFGAALFALVHGRDGIYELGQRDLFIAVLLLLAYAACFHSVRKSSPGWMLLFGLCASTAATIKPLFLPLGAVLLLYAVAVCRRKQQPISSFVVWGALGLTLPIAAMFSFLWAMHAVRDFFAVMRDLMPYHAALARKPLGYLLVHSFSPLLPLVAVWIGCLFAHWRQWKNWEGVALLIGLSFGLSSYIIQGKGYSYHRYPFLALLLLIMSIDFHRGLYGNRWTRKAAWAGIAFGVLFLAPVSTVMASRYDWRNTEFSSLLRSDLRRLGGQELSGRVQCIDTIGGCFDVLYQMNLLQTGRFVYDEFLFGSPKSDVVDRSRERFIAEMQATPPEFVVITDDLFPSGPTDFRKLEKWPEFAVYLHKSYSLCAEGQPRQEVKWWSRAEAPHSYRIFCRS
jgi:hypothetical protein